MVNAFLFDGRGTLRGPFYVYVADASLAAPGKVVINGVSDPIASVGGTAQAFVDIPNRMPSPATVVFIIEFADGCLYAVAKTVDGNIAGQYVLAVPNPSELQKSLVDVYGSKVGGTEPALRSAMIDFALAMCDPGMRGANVPAAQSTPYLPPPVKQSITVAVDGSRLAHEFEVAPAFFVGGEKQLDVKAPTPSNDNFVTVHFPLAGTARDFVAYLLVQYPDGSIYLTGYAVSPSKPFDLKISLPSLNDLVALPNARADDGTLLVADTSARLRTLVDYWAFVGQNPEAAISTVEVAEETPQAEPDDTAPKVASDGNRAVAFLSLAGLIWLSTKG